MAKFREHHDEGFLAHTRVPREDGARFWQWAANISRWLDDTSHISIRYGVRYDGVDIEQLSPGTRGIVLLLLYVSVDQSDDRPLIIDQPEENLDPKSIFDELVQRFREVELRRQVIIVTHNANLVVNTDADQIIVASVGAHRRGKLPTIGYESGGLEDPQIRRKVCEILEGGEQAFRDRARRLRVQLPR
jgi:ABC-type enterochelin transport system ATPase subunit